MLLLRFTKHSDQRHSLAYVRSDGTGEAAELETRSFLVHDLCIMRWRRTNTFFPPRVSISCFIPLFQLVCKMKRIETFTGVCYLPSPFPPSCPCHSSPGTEVVLKGRKGLKSPLQSEYDW